MPIYPSIPYPYVPAESDFVDGYYSSIGCYGFCGARRRMARRLTIRFRKICVIGHDYTHPPLTARRKQTETDVNYVRLCGDGKKIGQFETRRLYRRH